MPINSVWFHPRKNLTSRKMSFHRRKSAILALETAMKRPKFALRGAFWAVAGTMISRFLGLASSIFAARIVGKLHYGELGMI